MIITRRRLPKTAAASGFAVSAPGLAMPALAQGNAIKIGCVSPQSGPLTVFAEADAFTMDTFTRLEAKKS
jgi:branched-chain amino acid transport system substrate-binding protein